jgi:probable phosphoglycerate mutase
MSELILIRHGETAWNAVKRLQGHIDIPLNEEGLRQAQAVAAALGACGAQCVISSDLMRARDTAQPIAKALGLPLREDPLLRERAFGAFEGLIYDEIEQHFPDAFVQWQARELHVRYPAGERSAETLAELAHRVGAILASLAQAHEKVVVVSHGGVLDCAYRLATGMDMRAPRNFDVKNASINRFGWQAEDGLKLLEWGNVAHLQTAMDEPVRESNIACRKNTGV